MMNKREKRIILIVVLCQFIVNFLSNMITILLEISQEFNISYEMVNWLSISFYVAMVAVAIPIANIVSNWGIKKYMKANLFILIAALLLSGFSYDFNMLLISRIIHGITFAALAVCLYILVVTQLDEDSISIALGFVSSAGYIAVTSAPVISSWTSYLTSWRINFLLVIIFCIIDYILLFNTELDWHEEKELNMTGSLLYALLMVFFTVGLINLDENWGIVLFGLSIALTVIFIAHEKNSENKIYNLSLLKDRKYVIGNFAAFTSYFTTFILTYIVTLYLEINIKISPQISD